MHDLTETDIRDSRLRRLYDYWLDCHIEGRPPSRADLDPLDFPYAIGFVTLIEVERDPLRFRFRLAAGPISRHLGYDLTGKYLEDVPEPAMQAYLRESYCRVVDGRVPLHDRGERVLDRRIWRHESMLLPCCDADGEVSMIISARIVETPKILADSDQAR